MKEQLEKYKKLFSLMFDDLKTKGKRHKQIPNIVTLTRFLAPLIIIPSFIVGNFLFAINSAIVFELTDTIDGFIARRFKLVSDLGKDLDAVTDKIFAGTLLISLSTVNPIYSVSLVLEAIIGIICSYKKVQKIDIKTCKLGKIKTIFLSGFIVLGMTSCSIWKDLSPIIFNLIFGVTSLLQVGTLVTYAKANEPIKDSIQNEEEKDEKVELIEEIEEEKTYDKTLKYPHTRVYSQNKGPKTLVKTKK